ncbi:hypothetical protein KSS87_000570 [Heliosperma pusillum]|nr:hypothetical protein KSS87_000570 [Heliosperma pusillum]
MASLYASSTQLPNYHHISLLLGKWKTRNSKYIGESKSKIKIRRSSVKMESTRNGETKLVWIWTENKQVMTTAVERGWNTFLFDSTSSHLPMDWSSIALINPLYIKDGEVVDAESTVVASFLEISSPQHLDHLLVMNHMENVAIPAENIVATFQGNNKRVLAVAQTVSQAQMFLQALEHGLGGIVLKVEDIDPVLELKVPLQTDLLITGMGDRVCVDLCSLLRPGDGLLVGSFARGLFLVHSECLETNYIASRPFRVNAGPVHSYVAIPGGKTCYLSELKAGKEVIVVDQNGQQRTGIVGRVKIESRPLVLIEAKGSSDQSVYSILLQNAETVAFVSPCEGHGSERTAIPVTSLKVGDEVLLRVQGGARHTGIEIQEFIVEK